MGCRSLWGILQPMWIYFLQKARRNCALKVTKGRNIAGGMRKKYLLDMTESSIHCRCNFRFYLGLLQGTFVTSVLRNGRFAASQRRPVNVINCYV